MYQTVSENTYINGNKVTVYGDNTFGIGAGKNNTYIIQNTGSVYAAGDNTYGSIGNGTRDGSTDHTIVGDRVMKIEPENKSMRIGETEDIEIDLMQFNVFKDKAIDKSEFTVESNNIGVVSVDGNGRLSAVAEGIAEITVTDKITNKQVVLKRAVERALTDDISIKRITASSKLVDNTYEEVEAKLVGNSKMTYEIEVTEFTDISKIKIQLNEAESKLSIDGTPYVKEKDEKDITLDEDIKEVKFSVKSEAGTIAEYTLIIRKVDWIPPEINIVEIYAKGGDNIYEAKKVDEENYEIKVPGILTEVDVTGITEFVKDKVQINNTGIYVQNKDTQKISIANEETLVSIKIQSEDGTTEKEYTLKIIKMSNNVNLEKVEVDGEAATLEADGNYHYYLKSAKTKVNVKAYTQEKTPVLAYVNIENNSYDLYETEKEANIIAKQTEVKIKVKAEDGSTKTHKLIIEGLPDDTTIKEVIINGNEAKYIEGKNRYEIKDSSDSFKVEVTLNDILASMELGDNPKTVGKDNITVTKTGNETIIKVKVTSQNGLETEEYEIAVLEKSNNNNLQKVIVNGKEISKAADGNYKTDLPNASTGIEVEAIAEDSYAKTEINSNANSSYIASIKENVVEGKNVYEYTIAVTAEDGSTGTYILEVEILEANYNISGIYVGKEIGSLEEVTTITADGKYYYKIDRVEKAYVQVNPESTKTTIEILGNRDMPVEVNLPQEITEIPIKIIGEDGTYIDEILVIEKKSNNADIVDVQGEGITKVEIEEDVINLYINEELMNLELKIIAKSKFGELKLDTEENFEIAEIVRNIDLSNYSADDRLSLVINVKAEDGTSKNYTMYINKEANLELLKVQVNDDILTYNETNERYETVVQNGNKPQIILEPENQKQKVELYDKSGKLLASNTGTLTTVQTLNADGSENDYIIKVVSQNGEDYGYAEYPLNIRQKSQETGIIYIKVDNLGTIVSEDGLTYTGTVAGKEKYPVEIKLIDEKAKVRIEDLEGNVLITDKLGILTGELEVIDGETKNFKVVVTSENGDEKEYALALERISSNTEIKNLTVTDYDTDKNIITRPVVEYNEATKTYRIVVDSTLVDATVTVETEDSSAEITLDNGVAQKGVASTIKNLLGVGTEIVTIKIKAADGTLDTRYLEIVQLSEDNSLKEVYVNGVLIAPREDGNYEADILDTMLTPIIKAVTTNEFAIIKIASGTEKVHEAQENITLSTEKQTAIPITVKSESGITKVLYLYLNKISTNTNLENVTLDGKQANDYDQETKTYTFIVDGTKTSYELFVLAESNYTILEYDGNNYQASLTETVNMLLTENEKVIKIIAKAEAENEQEYNIKIIREDKNSYITGKITTENVNGEHISEVRVYRIIEKPVTTLDEETHETITEIVKELKYVTGVYTDNDGTFKVPVYNPDKDDIELLNSKYTVVISKVGYLDYTVEDVEIEEESISDIGEYHLNAGDVVRTGEIEIDDLVQMNNRHGTIINATENGVSDANAKYDLNEDGVVDGQDRAILVSNYGELAETVKWQNLQTSSFVGQKVVKKDGAF